MLELTTFLVTLIAFGFGYLVAQRLTQNKATRTLGELLHHLHTHQYPRAKDVLRRDATSAADLQNSISVLENEFHQQSSANHSLEKQLMESKRIAQSLQQTSLEQKKTILDLQNLRDKLLVIGAPKRTASEDLSRNIEETSSSILQMVAVNREVNENIHGLASSVQESTSAIEEMTFSIKEVARNIEELSTAAEETATSMNEMNISIGEVESNADQTTQISENVTTDAETGMTAITRTISGIDKIKDSSRVASDVILNLGEKIEKIGSILTVIDDVAEQTNLLALNAAIIAAQAGEHGRGFAVVADEIKALAERTGVSTKEIAELIKTIQNESKNAITVMQKGVEDVEQGVRLGHNAEEALRKILESAKRSTLMIKAIAGATIEQAKGSKQVTDAIRRIAETVQQISTATHEQAKGSEQIMKNAERMRIFTQQVERNSEEQGRGTQQITQAIENIREMTEYVAIRETNEKELAQHFDHSLKSLVREHGDLAEQSRALLTTVESSQPTAPSGLRA